MTWNHRLRRRVAAALPAAALLALAACDPQAWPNTTLVTHSEFGRDIDALWDKLLFWGTLVFVFVELLLVWVVIKYRYREGRPQPKHVHGNTTLEIIWTAIPAVILAMIAVPTVRTIFRTQAKPVAGALQVEVIGHQWWWEFRYPEYGITTANELWLPTGRTVNFALKTADVIHSFWIPRLGGKRDLIANHTNYLWFTPDSTLGVEAWNGQCVEYCGASHANMKFRAFTVPPEQFAQWVEHQRSPAAFGAVTPAAPATATTAAAPAGQAPGAVPSGNPATGTASVPGTTPATTPVPVSAAPQTAAMGFTFPQEKWAPHLQPQTPLPPSLAFEDNLTGDAARGQQLFSRNACIACHKINGNPSAVGVIGPDLTHVGSRLTLAAGLFPNDTRHLARWIKNATKMKPGSLMPPMGAGEQSLTGTPPMARLSDQEIADIVAYLQALK